MERLGPPRDPFATPKALSSKKIDDRYISTSGLSVNSRMSRSSAMSGRSITKREVRHMLGNQRDNNAMYTSLVNSKIMGSRMEISDLAPEGFVASRRGSTASNIGMSQVGLVPLNRRGSNASQIGLAPRGLAAPGGPRAGRRGSTLGEGYAAPTMSAQRRVSSAFGPAAFNIGKVVPDDLHVSVNLLMHGDGSDEELDTSWRALPKWWTDMVPNHITASVSLGILTGLTIFVLIDSIIRQVNG